MVQSDTKSQRNITEYLKTKESGNAFMQELIQFKDSMFRTKSDFTTDNVLALNRKYSAIIGKDIMPSSEDSLGYIEKLIRWVEGCELVTVVLAFKPTDAFIETIYDILAPKILNPFLLDIKIETTMIGGIQFTINGKHFDFSLDSQLSNYFSTHKDAIISELQNEFTQGLESIGEIGYVQSVLPPIVYVKGLPEVHFGEVVYFESGEMGFILSFTENLCEVLVFSPEPVLIGTRVCRSGNVLHIPVGEEYLGRSINPLGYSTATSTYIPKPKKVMPIEQLAPGIDKRFKIKEPFETGVTVVDMMIPLGKGQRELVIGDRKTGKTEFLMQTMLTQARQNVICVYTGIGRKKSDIKRVEEFIKKTGFANNFIIVSTSSTDPLGLIYITPYSAMMLAEYFVSQGKDVLLILDDLSTHAKFYREIALIGKRFPGRNSYPGDMFYAHSRLLERAGCFITPTGSNAITCLAAAETIESDISGYIQTNLMSTTDGHIYFDHELFEQGRRPAVNYFLSVTRVGRQTQNKIRWGINRELSSFMTLYEKTQRYIHFGAEINEGIKSTLSMGSRLLAFFDQPMGKIVYPYVQIFVFCLIWVGAITEDTDARIRFLTEEAASLYETDLSFKDTVDNLIKDSSDFNMLLGKISAQSKDLVKMFDVALSANPEGVSK